MHTKDGDSIAMTFKCVPYQLDSEDEHWKGWYPGTSYRRGW